jgi:hypothetical protein
MLTAAWLDWFSNFVNRVGTSSQRINAVPLVAQAGSISPTNLAPSGALNGGLYRFEWYYQVTQAAGTSCTFTMTIGWTNRGVSQTYSWPANTGNNLTTNDSGTRTIRVDPNSPLTYSTTYGSVGAPVMTYSLDVVLIQVQA